MNHFKRLVFTIAFVSLSAVAGIVILRRTNLPQQQIPLLEARRGFKTQLRRQDVPKEAPEVPPSAVFRLVEYGAATGDLAAYVSPDPKDGEKHPAIVWITGGDSNTIDDIWTPQPPSNDQSAAQYRRAGIVMMFPSLRGGNRNPGEKESFLGEVDDALAAADYLAKLRYVDPKRIYLGGHSTGGTLAMLVAECSNRFRSVFAFGPLADVSRYGVESGFLPFDVTNRTEILLRSPGYWLSSVQSPLWVFEGAKRGNIKDLRQMRWATSNPLAHFVEINNATHFSTLAPTNSLIANKILADTEPVCNITFSEDEVNRNFNINQGADSGY